MVTRLNEIEVYRGESFTIHKALVNNDGSPYVISSELSNPYYLLSISNGKYSQEGRVVFNYWLSLEQYPRFYSTNIVNLADVTTDAEGGTTLYDDFDDIKSFPINGYYKGEYVTIPSTYAVFHSKGKYKYWEGEWKEYTCELIKTFTSDDTSEWLPMEYLYSIQLVSGISTTDVLKELCTKYNISYVDNVQAHTSLVEAGYVFPINFEVTQPLGRIVSSVPVLVPTRLSVNEYLQGDIL